MICPKCGESNESKFTFCVRCGSALKTGEKMRGFFSKDSGGQSRADAYSTRKSFGSRTDRPESTRSSQRRNPEPSPMERERRQPSPPPMGNTSANTTPMTQSQPVQTMANTSVPATPPTQQLVGNAMPMLQPQGMVQPQMMGMPNPYGQLAQPQAMPTMDAMGIQPMAQQMPVQPQMMGMQAMPQLMGYDANGMPIYMQMVTQVIGYDTFGNPMYGMVPMQGYGAIPQMGMNPMGQMVTPQMGMPTPMAQPITQQAMENPPTQATPSVQAMAQPMQNLGTMAVPTPQINAMGTVPNAMPTPDSIAQGFAQPVTPTNANVMTAISNRAVQEQASIPTAPSVVSEPMSTAPPASEKQVEGVMAFESSLDMPVTADSLMQEEYSPTATTPTLSDEADLLNRIFEEKPSSKQYTVSNDSTSPSRTYSTAPTFSINLSASEVVSVHEELPTSSKVTPMPMATEATPTPSATSMPKANVATPSSPTRVGAKPSIVKSTTKPEPTSNSKKTKIISADDFFGDTYVPPKRGVMHDLNMDVSLEDDAVLQEQLGIVGTQGHKKSRRQMAAADHEIDPLAVLEDPAVAAAAQAILDQVQ